MFKGIQLKSKNIYSVDWTNKQFHRTKMKIKYIYCYMWLKLFMKHTVSGPEYILQKLILVTIYTVRSVAICVYIICLLGIWLSFNFRGECYLYIFIHFKLERWSKESSYHNISQIYLSIYKTRSKLQNDYKVVAAMLVIYYYSIHNICVWHTFGFPIKENNW